MQRASLYVGAPDLFNLANFQPHDEQPSSPNEDRATSPTSARSVTSTASAFTPRVITPTPIQWAKHKPSQPFQEVRKDSFLEKEKGREKDKKGYVEPPPVSPLDSGELRRWSFYRAALAEFVATGLFLYFTLSAVMGASKEAADIGGIGLVGISWSFGGMIFVLVYCTAGISGTTLEAQFQRMVMVTSCIMNAFYHTHNSLDFDELWGGLSCNCSCFISDNSPTRLILWFRLSTLKAEVRIIAARH